jgi:DNA-binding transcriptional regulator YdaS (Cro superfamily)
MKLVKYIEEQGDHVAARRFRVKVRTVRSWRYGDRAPRPAKAVEIERVTRRQVTVAECYR